MSKEKENIFLIDGNSFCYRAFYAIQDLSTSKGMPTNAIYGVINMLHKLIKEHNPAMMAVVFDLKGPTVRHKKYEEYKIHRKPMPDELATQISRIKEVITAHNIPVYELQGFEADDIIATLARKADKKGLDVIIVTGDKDALQLVDDKTKVLSPHLKESKVYDRAEVKRKYGVDPKGMVELMAFMGDASDNIPGVKGIGQVTAQKLIDKYGSVEGVYKNIDKITSKPLKEKLLKGKEMAALSRELLVLDKSLPVELDTDKMRLGKPDQEQLARLYREFEFQKLLKELMPEEKEAVKYSAHSGEKDIKRIIDRIKKEKFISLSMAENPDTERICGIAFSLKEGEADYIPLDEGSEDSRKILNMLKDILEDRKIKKIAYNVKKDLICLGPHGLKMEDPRFDVMIADYLAEPSLPKRDLASIAMRNLGYNFSSGTDDAPAGSSICEQSDIILRLYGRLESELEKKHLMDLFLKVEMPLIDVLAQMEEEGVGIDVEYVKKMSAKIGKELAGVTQRIYDLAGEEFNINSPKQLQVILFDKLGLPTMKKIKTGASTDESVLRKLAPLHELPAELLEYRTLSKLKSTYYDSILEMTDKKTRKLHTNFNQAVTATGRLSSSEPNLQNIPIKTEVGKEIRRSFVPGEKDRLMLAADYSQIELRILAHLSEDKDLLKAFKKEEDVHRFTASLIFDTTLEEVTDRMRTMAKTVNFGIVYGMSSFGLAKDLGISVGEAQKFIDSYFNRYSGVKAFIDKTIETARKKGYVTTLLNRRRYIPEISSSNEHMKGFAERAAINTRVQGSAADIIKLAMLECYKGLKDTGARMIIQVHDELIFTIPKDKTKDIAKRVKGIMEGVVDLKVPLIVDIEAGENWMDLEPVESG